MSIASKPPLLLSDTVSMTCVAEQREPTTKPSWPSVLVSLVKVSNVAVSRKTTMSIDTAALLLELLMDNHTPTLRDGRRNP